MLISSKDLKQIQESLTSFDEIREKMLAVSRVATRLSDWSIIQMHRNDMERAEISLKEAKEALVQIRNLVKNTPELRQTGSVLVAYQEYVEAVLLQGPAERGKARFVEGSRCGASAVHSGHPGSHR